MPANAGGSWRREFVNLLLAADFISAQSFVAAISCSISARYCGLGSSGRSNRSG
jgi:hypothetical protein